jgi:predicted acylesterase/phospholipase RssA
MKQEDLRDSSAQYWYRKPGSIEHWFCGVFEGGGAKGVAYSGALLAMKEKKCWFSAVAGASAGAITAALVAAGLSPEEMENATEVGLGLVQTGVWAGLGRLKNEAGFFPSDKLSVWLDEIFRAQVARGTGITPDTKITFRQLFLATDIELNIVAADLSLRCHAIFSHIDTPNCAVADAVVASSSIPFAFPSRLLQVPEGTTHEHVCHHTIVDGGVWANFPMFIFEDSAFRKFYKREPVELGTEQILGFLLKRDQPAAPRGEDIRFVREVPASAFRAREWEEGNQKAVGEPAGLMSSVGAWLLYPFSLLGRVVEWNGGVERGRWPAPRSALARNLVQSVTGLLAGIHPPLFALLAWAVVAVGAWQVVSFLGIDQFNALRGADWTHPLSYVVRALMLVLVLIAVAVAVLVVFAGSLGVVANLVLLRASRRILYGLITTYVAGPGAAVWVRERRNIIALPVPPTVTTLSFKLQERDRRALIASARQVTLAKLTELLSGGCGSTEQGRGGTVLD